MNTPETRRIVAAAVLIGAGVVLLALRFFDVRGGFFWPFFIIAPGVILLAVATSTGWHSRTLAGAGGIITGTGVILLVQNLTNYYDSWAYAWTLLPVSAGLALYLVADASDNDAARAVRRQLVVWGVIAFVVLGTLFETLIFHDRLAEGGVIVPLLLIAAGIAVFFFGGRTSGTKPRD